MRVSRSGKITAAVLMLGAVAWGHASNRSAHLLEPITTTGSFVLDATLPPPAGPASFGQATAMWNDAATGTNFAVVGAPSENASTGAAYVFRRAPGDTNWSEEARLTASDGAPADEFGFSVAIDGDTVVVGAPTHIADFFTGAAYVFVRDPATGAWTQQGDALMATSDAFGWSVALRGDTLAVGDTQCECVQTYVRSAGMWTSATKLAEPAELSVSGFGFSLAMTDDYLLVGAPLDNAVAPNQGAAVLYAKSRDGWDTQQFLRPEIDTSAMQMFGFSVALSDAAIVVGAPMRNAQNGDVHTFGFDAATARWTEQSLLSDTTGALKPFFGGAIALSGDLLAIGAPGVDSSAAIYRLHGTAWTLESILTGDRGAGFGISVAAAGNEVLVGAPASGDDMRGAAYVFISDRIFADGIEK